MRLRNMLKICLVFWKSEPQYAYQRYAYKKKHVLPLSWSDICYCEYSYEISLS